MNAEEKANYEKIVKDLSIENLSDQEIVEMWKSPAIQQIEEGLSNFKLERFLISKGVSKDYAPEGVKWIRAEAGLGSDPTKNKLSLGSILTDMFQSLAEKLTRGKR